jgi:hypothetical protein
LRRSGFQQRNEPRIVSGPGDFLVKLIDCNQQEFAPVREPNNQIVLSRRIE